MWAEISPPFDKGINYYLITACEGFTVKFQTRDEIFTLWTEPPGEVHK